MQSVIAYLITAWCYAVFFITVLWLVPTFRRYGFGFQAGMFLVAASLVARANDAWLVANGAGVADYWFFRNAIQPAALTMIILQEYSRYSTRRRKERLKRIQLLADGGGICVCPTQPVAFGSRARREEREERAIADQGGVIS